MASSKIDEIFLQAYAISYMNGIRGLAGWRWVSSQRCMSKWLYTDMHNLAIYPRRHASHSVRHLYILLSPEL